MILIEIALSWRVATLAAIILALTFAAACGGGSKDTASPSCAGFEVVEDRTGLISRTEAEDMAVERLSMSAPEVSPTEVERVWASCLTTYGSYQEHFYREGDWIDPDLHPLDTSVWIVKAKGISRPAGIATASAHAPYHFSMGVRNAKTGDMLEGTRYREPMLQPVLGE